jgi:hypothetical protein
MSQNISTLKTAFRIVVVLVLAILINSCGSVKAVHVYKEKRKEIIRLVPIGMDIDEASILLKKKDFEVGDKYTPTADKDYYWVEIWITGERTLAIKIMKFFGVEYYNWVVIEAGLDNKVRKIL